MTDITRGFAELQVRLSGGNGAEREAARQRLSAHNAAVIAKNDAEIEAEWRALGTEPHRTADGRLVSVSLAKMMRLKPIEKQEDAA